MVPARTRRGGEPRHASSHRLLITFTFVAAAPAVAKDPTLEDYIGAHSPVAPGPQNRIVQTG
jgi:hypothetical protein